MMRLRGVRWLGHATADWVGPRKWSPRPRKTDDNALGQIRAAGEVIEVPQSR